jgi:hypothetical protein
MLLSNARTMPAGALRRRLVSYRGVVRLVCGCAVTALVLGSLGCASESPQGQGRVDLADSRGDFPVNPRLALARIDLERHVPGALRAEEERLISELRALLPAAAREELLAVLMDDSSGGFIAASPDPRIADLVSRIYAIREADHEASRRMRPTSVVVAFPERWPYDDPAVILRRPQGDLMLINRTHLTGVLLKRSIGALYGSYRREGGILRREVRINVPVPRGAAPESSMGAVLDKLLLAARPSDLPGIGPALTTTLQLRQ